MDKTSKKGSKIKAPAKTKKTNWTSLGESPWKGLDPYSPVQDIFNPNTGGSKKANAPAANAARGSAYPSPTAKKKK